MKYIIMQLRGEHRRELFCESYERTTTRHGGVKQENYEEIYSGDIEAASAAEALEKLYYIFNMRHPADFTGHSMSVSDIVILDQCDEAGTYFCDRFGFKKLPESWQPKTNEPEEPVVTAEEVEKLAYEIREFLIKHELWQDVRIYFNGKALATDDGNGNFGYNDPDKLFILEDQDPRKYFEYVSDYLSMSFEGPLYDVLNCYAPFEYCNKIHEQFSKIIGKYGLYYEQGHAWSLTLYPA